MLTQWDKLLSTLKKLLLWTTPWALSKGHSFRCTAWTAVSKHDIKTAIKVTKGGMQEGHIQFCSQNASLPTAPKELISSIFLSSNKSKTFYSIDLICLSVLKLNILLMYV